jgi:hypothetical protein
MCFARNCCSAALFSLWGFTMNIAEQPSAQVEPDPALPSDLELALSERKIGGFDSGTRPLYKEPSLYLSIVTILITTMIYLGKTPALFCLSFGSLTAVAVMLHVLAERILSKSNSTHEPFPSPLEGIFILVFGAILPGLGLLTYAGYSLATAVNPNFPVELGKIVLLLALPFFNFSVWSAVRRGYLLRPRLTGLMNGLALGLSACWSLICMKVFLFSQVAPACKMGWLLLLCVSPFMLWLAASLSFDLCRKTDPHIARVTKIFSVLGGLMAILFVFTPVARSLYVQSLITAARTASPAEQPKALAALRAVASPEDLRPSKNPINGFALAELLIPGRGMENDSDADKDLYFKLTGEPYNAQSKEDKVAVQTSVSGLLSGQFPGLTLAKSQLTGFIDAATLSSSIDWTMTLHNSEFSPLQAVGEIGLPEGAAVTRVTLWVNGEPREAAFARTAQSRAAYDSVVAQRKDPLLVSMVQDRLLIQCFPVPAKGDMKIRIGFKVPLETSDGKTCSMQWPKVLAGNFAQPKRHRVSLLSSDMPVDRGTFSITRKGSGYALNGILKGDYKNAPAVVVVRRNAAFTKIVTADSYSHGQRFIVEQFKEVTTKSPRRVFVVVDASASLKGRAPEIREALASIPPSLTPVVYFNSAQEALNSAQEAQSKSESEASAAPILQARSIKEAEAALNEEVFVGGQDNLPLLQEVIENAAEQPGNAVLWIHGPQPLSRNLSQVGPLDLVHSIRLYNMQIEPGVDATKEALLTADAAHQLNLKEVKPDSTVAALKSLAHGWSHGEKSFKVVRSVATERPQAMISDPMSSAQVTGLWANEEVNRLITAGQNESAEVLASAYRLVTPVSGAVVLENAQEYGAHGLNPGAYKDYDQKATVRTAFHLAPLTYVSPPYVPPTAGAGLVGIPVDPRYGQSNEVGQLADYGYDCARDITRLLTALSALVAVILGLYHVRSRKANSISVSRLKVAALVVAIPAVVHLLGTFVINNFGGLGGGL